MTVPVVHAHAAQLCLEPSCEHTSTRTRKRLQRMYIYATCKNGGGAELCTGFGLAAAEWGRHKRDRIHVAGSKGEWQLPCLVYRLRNCCSVRRFQIVRCENCRQNDVVTAISSVCVCPLSNNCAQRRTA